MQLKTPSRQGFRFDSILIHSLWITVVGILLFRLATANTQQLLYVEIFAVSGVVLATAPWVIQLLVSTLILFLYKTDIYDLTWLVTLPSEEASCCQDLSATDEEIGGGFKIANRNLRGMSDEYGRISVSHGLGFFAQVNDGRNGPRLQRNRTV